MKTIVIMGAGGRDFHDFNVLYRDDPFTCVAAFTAAQIPGIDDRTQVIDGPQSVVWQQAANRLPTEEALLYALIARTWEPPES